MNWYKKALQQQFEFVKNMPQQPKPKTEESKEFQDLLEKSNVDLAEKLEYDVHNYQDLINTLNTFKIPWKRVDFPDADPIIKLEYNGKHYLIDSFEYPELKNPREWIWNIFDHNLDNYVLSQDFNKIFWDEVSNGSFVYHATTEENKDSILKNGLLITDKTRGINNKYTGNAVFTSDNPDDISSYGNVIFAINLGKMKAEGYMPQVSKEEPIQTSEQRSTLAYLVGADDMDLSDEYASEGIYGSTVIFYDNIPPKYLRIEQL